MDKQQAEELLERYRNNLCTPEERERLELLFMQQVQNTEVPESDAVPDEIWEAISEHIAKNGNPYRHRIRRSLLIKYASAAILLIIASISVYNKFRSTESSSGQVRIIEDIKPGGNRAYLTLADGRRITLDSNASGVIAQQANIVIRNTAEGELEYKPSSPPPNNPENPIFNTLVIPRGGQYQLTLPDGSKVWLNAASSLKFPASFDGMATRHVELTGEAYFEITRQAQQPFIVRSSSQQIQVLGTHFNVAAYPDEPFTRTTLIEGKIAVLAAGQRKEIKPGFEALVTESQLDIAKADAEIAIAWKNGNIKFKDQDLPTIMRTISRWYDLDVKYEGPATPKRFTGFISRKSSLSSLLKILKLSKIDFELHEDQGRKVLTVKQ